MKKILVCSEAIKEVSDICRMISALFPVQFEVLRYISPKQLQFDLKEEELTSTVLAFIDLDMKEMDGILLSRELREKISGLKVFFLSETSLRAEEIFDDFLPSGFFLKPLQQTKVEKSLRRELETESKHDRQVKLKKSGRLVFLGVDEVVYVESDARKLLIHKRDGSTECVYEKLSQFCIDYEQYFVRCHQSYAVNISCVQEISVQKILMTTGKEIPVSRKRYAQVVERVSEGVDE